MLICYQLHTARQIGKSGGQLQQATKLNPLADEQFANQFKKIWDGLE